MYSVQYTVHSRKSVQFYIISAGHNTALFYGSKKLSVIKTSQAHCSSTVSTAYTRVSQYVLNFRFLNVFIIRQAHLLKPEIE